MKTFQTFSQLRLAHVPDTEPTQVLSPTTVIGTVESTGEGLTLASGNVFIPSFTELESLLNRKVVLLDTAFVGSTTSFISHYARDTDGEWAYDANGLLSAVYLNGRVWVPIETIPYAALGYQVINFNINASNVLTVSTNLRTIQYVEYTGLDPRPTLQLIREVTGSNYTLLPSDSGYFITFNFAGQCTLTVPAGLTNGTSFLVNNVDATAGSGVDVSFTDMSRGATTLQNTDGYMAAIKLYDEIWQLSERG